ncbi:MAG: phosphoglucosamine mutase [Solirubrobacteraceae bacterium]
MPGRLFGTDGVRGVAGTQLSAALALRLGEAATRLAPAPRPRVLIVRDTRESGEMLDAALAAGVSSAGGDVLRGGVLPTPAAPLLLRRHGLDLAAVISASHNPYADNGIKLFAGDGYKLSDELEQQIEAALAEGSDPGAEIGRIDELHGASEDYLRELHTRFAELDLSGMRIALDCANGATYAVAPELFRRLGAEVSALAVDPDGRNINDRCGSTHVERLSELMRAGAHDVGFAFDGDGDRVLAVDAAGVVVDGDGLLALAALHLRASGRLAGGGVAVTVMTNYGFHSAMERAAIDVATTKVGDRHVLEELRARGWALGGEQSGHIIELGFNTSGDGLAAALLTLEALAGADLREREAMERLPQSLLNVALPNGARELAGQVASAAAVEEEVEAVSRELAGRGRVLVRASGTEPLVRVMVEAPSEREAKDLCRRLATAVEDEIARGRG